MDMMTDPKYRRFGGIQIRPAVNDAGNLVETPVWGQLFAHRAFYAFTAVNEQTTVVVRMLADADFELQAINAFSTDPDYFINITDGASGLKLFQDFLPASTVVGTGQRPFWLPTTVLFDRNGSIEVQLQNGVAAAVNTVYISMLGQRVFETIPVRGRKIKGPPRIQGQGR